MKKRLKDKKYETRSYDYYDKKEALNIICAVLSFNGWVIYGYKEDRSDFMTDYYDPARWDGIAVKNGYILVMNKSYSGGTIAGNYVLRSYSKEANEIINKLVDKNQKLLTLANNEAASEGEKTNALAMIEKNNQKIQSFRNEYYLEEDSNNPYPANLPEVTYQKNPGRATWHIEKDGKIIDKGTGYFKYCDIDGMKYFLRPSTINFQKLQDNSYDINERYNEESWKVEYEYLLNRQDKNEGLLDDFMNFIQLLESKVKIVLGDGEEEQLVRVIKEVKEIYYTAESTTEKTDYIQVSKGWNKVSGLSSGNIYKLEDNKVFKLTRKSLSENGQYISSYKPNPNKSTNPLFISSVEEKIREKKLTYVKLVENYITYEKEEWIKPKKSDSKTTKNKDIKVSPIVNDERFQKILQNVEIIEKPHSKSGEILKVFKVDEDLGTDFQAFATYVNKNDIAYYSKFIKAFVVKNIELIASASSVIIYTQEQIEIFASGKLF